MKIKKVTVLNLEPLYVKKDFEANQLNKKKYIEELQG